LENYNDIVSLIVHVAFGKLTYSLLERRQPNPRLLLSLGWLVTQHTSPQDVDLALREDVDLGQKGAVRILEGVREEETEDEARGDRERSH
jgi:hypothetical protein